MHKEIIRKGRVHFSVRVDETGASTLILDYIPEEKEVYRDSCLTNAQESQREQVSHEVQAEQKRLPTWFKRGLRGLRWLGELVLMNILASC